MTFIVKLLFAILIVSIIALSPSYTFAFIVVVSKDTNLVEDACDSGCEHDDRFFINMLFLTNPIPEGDSPKKYMLNASNQIVKRPLADLIKIFPDEWRANLRALIAALPITITQDLRDILNELVNFAR